MYSVKLPDGGTPRRVSDTMVALEIDGVRVSVPAGTSVMRAATGAGVQVPKLCATDSLEAFGSCRLCLVEIEGRRGFPASCTTLVEPGMKVRFGPIWKVPTLVKKVPLAEVAEPPQLNRRPSLGFAAVRLPSEQNE